MNEPPRLGRLGLFGSTLHTQEGKLNMCGMKNMCRLAKKGDPNVQYQMGEEKHNYFRKLGPGT